ncbi:MAG: hypothetical protein H0V82_06290 [Candidatus Protochlamydia sp.]|nr:hypothetical protein [Candidatus Protochlamydia sp.]
MRKILNVIVSSTELHAKWLNTLSYLENCGARKIAACEHPALVKEEMLKHAAEEFRHAHHLKRQIEKITLAKMETYALPWLLGGTASLHYLRALDIRASRYLQEAGYFSTDLREAAYFLVTYAIECRADELYLIYDDVLRQAKSRVGVKSILLEEKEHLNEMREGLQQLPSGMVHANKICSIESELCEKWLFVLKSKLKCIN